MLNEIFKPITCEILNGVREGYSISNFGRLFDLKNNTYLEYFSNKNNRYECNININNKQYSHFNLAILEYCIFNNLKYDNSIIIKYKDNNPYNINIDNLYCPRELWVPDGTIIINNLISSSNYYINPINILCYYTDELWINITQKEVPNILPLYMISSYGRVYNKEYGSILHNQISYNGYINAFVKSINDNYINLSIHRTMMKCFYPINNWDDYEVNHINNNSLDNTLNNIEWVTKEENERIMLLHSENKKFTKEQVIAICQAFEKNMSFIEICVHVLNIEYTGNIHWKLSNIKRRQTYKEISENYNF